MKTLDLSKRAESKRRASILNYFLLIAVVATAILFSILQPAYLNVTNVMNILRTASIYAILSMAGMFVQLTGDINFAMGAQAMVAAGIIGRLADMSGLFHNYAVSFVATLLIVAGIGLFCGFIVIRFKIPALIGTLSVQMILVGVNKFLTDNHVYMSRNWERSYYFLGQGRLFGVVPMPFIVCIVMIVIAFILTERTKYGRYLYSVGANTTACTQMGINVKKIKYIAYALSATFAAVAGILTTANAGVVTNTIYEDLFTPALCAVFLGATFYKLGVYNVLGSFLASVFMVMITNGVLSAGGMFYVKDMVEGAILLVAVGIVAVFRKEGLRGMSFDV